MDGGRHPAAFGPGAAPGASTVGRHRRGRRVDSFAWPEGYRPACPVCGRPTTGIADVQALTGDRLVIMAVVDPCGCEVNQHAARLQAGASEPPADGDRGSSGVAASAGGGSAGEFLGDGGPPVDGLPAAPVAEREPETLF